MTQARVELLADSRQVRRATDDLKQLENRGKTTTTVTNQLRNAFVALGGALAVRELARLSDTYTGIQNRLRIVTDSTAQLTEVQGKLLQVANDSRAEFETTVGLYSTLARSTEELGLSQERLLRVTETINKAFAASGADAATAASAIRQLGQGLASGALRGDEFNSVAEGAPEIMRAIAAETGMTIGALREFAAQGKITSELLITSLENYGDTVDDIFSNSERTIAQSFQEARNNAIQFIGGIEAIDDASQAFGDSIVALSENLDLVIDAATVLAAIFAGRVAGAIGSNVAAFTAAQIQAARYQATLASMAGVSRTTAVALGGVSLAARGAGAAMAFLGGPIGVAVLAAGALVYFSDSAQTAAEKAAPLREEVDALRQSMQELSETELREEFNSLSREAFKVLPADIRRVKSELDSLNESILERQQSIAAPGGPNTLSPALLADMQRAQELEQRLESLTLEQAAAEEKAIALGDELVRLGESGKAAAEGVDEASGAASEGSKSFDSMVASLTEQIIELRDGADAAEDFAIAQRLGADASEDEKKKIDDLVATLRELREERENKRERERDKATGQTIGLSQELLVQQQLNEQLIELERLKNEGLLSEAASYEQRRAQLVADANERLASMRDEFEVIDWDSFENRAAGALAAVATGATDGKDAIRGLAQSLLTEAVGALIKLGIQSVASTLLASGAEQAAKATSVATTAATMTATTAATVAAATAATAAWTVPATLASIATLGGASATGLAALTAALAGGVTAATAASAASAAANAGVNALSGAAGARALGGQVIGGNQYLVGERGPELITMGSNGNVTPYNQLMREARTTNNSNNMTANISFTLPEGNADFRNRIADNRDLIYNVVADVLNDRGQRF